MLIVSQFTLAGDARHGNRPSFIRSARPEEGERLYDKLCQEVARCRPCRSARVSLGPI
jgi:D-tyrosyl-tRNA(Tyr) deacylase